MAPTRAPNTLDPPAASNLPPHPPTPNTFLGAWLALLVLLLAMVARAVIDAPESVGPMLGPAAEAPVFTLDAGAAGSH